MARLVPALLGLVLALGSLSAADDTYTIKFKELAKGETGSYDIAEKLDFFVQATSGGETIVDLSIKGEMKTLFWQRVVEKSADELPTKLLRGYGEARIKIQGETTVLPVEGKRVRVERKGNKYGYAIDGVKEGGGKFDPLLRAELEDSLTMTMFLPTRPVKLKESWRFDGRPIARYLAGRVGEIEFDIRKVDGIGRLTEVYDKDGKPFGRLITYLEIPILSLKAEGKKYAMRNGDKMVVQANFDICMDGSAHIGTVKVVPYISVNTVVEAEGQKVSLKVVFKSERTVTIKPGAGAK
jgi:hypothetical protein